MRLVSGFGAAVFSFLAAVSVYAAEVEVFSPQGTVKDARQVAVRFSAPMVALGDPRTAAPFTVDCPVTGTSRWADQRNWIYDFDADVPGGVRCHFSLKPETKTLAGAALSGQRTFSFSTGGPAIRASLPGDGASNIDEKQAFLLLLDAPAQVKTIEKNAYCAIDGIEERIPVSVIGGEQRTTLLKQANDKLGYRYVNLFRRHDYSSSDRLSGAALAAAEKNLVVVQCQRPIPAQTGVQIVWGKGIAAQSSGITTDQPQSLRFVTRPHFLVRFECDRVNPDAGCLPMRDMRLYFTSPITQEHAAAIRLTGSDGKTYKPTLGVNEQTPVVQDVVFKGPFPPRTEFKVMLSRDLTDDAGRTLQNAARFPLDVATDAYPPLVKFSGTFGILEAKEGGVLPVTLRSVGTDVIGGGIAIDAQTLRVSADDNDIAQWLGRVEKASDNRGEMRRDKDGKSYWFEDTGSQSVFVDSDQASSFALPKPRAVNDFEVVGIPLGKPGFYVVELKSPELGAALLGRQVPRYVTTAALVTNMAVHFNWGREASEVWVTTLDKAKPVAGAKVVVSNYCTGAKQWSGTTDEKGIARITASMPEPSAWGSCETWSRNHPLMVSARQGDDMSFTLTSWSNGIQPDAFGIRTGNSRDADMYHTVLDRPLFRAGETVSMKHFIRRHGLKGFSLPKDYNKKTTVVISHTALGQPIKQEVTFDSTGIAETQWQIPADAKLGEYRVDVGQGYGAATFRVEEFRVPTMRAVVQGPAATLVEPKSVTLDLFVSYLSGGGASNADVKLRTVLEPRSIDFPEYRQFSFGGRDVKEGITTDPFNQGRAQETTGERTRVLPLTLDENGAARVDVPDLNIKGQPMSLLAELEYQDANGEILTTVNRMPLWSSTVHLGLKTQSWSSNKDTVNFQVLAVDLNGKPIANQTVAVDLYSSVYYSYRKRLIGGFYAYENSQDVKKLKAKCGGKTDAQGLLYCDVAVEVGGEIVIVARTKDSKGHKSLVSGSAWVADSSDWWFSGSDGDRMDVLPEQREYNAGDTARFQVRMPFRDATALVSVLREGVVESFVTQLSGRNPVIEVPIKNSYSPNVFVSVLAIRGRTEATRTWLGRKSKDITAMVDLTKPAYRYGLAEIKVGWQPHRLDVKVETDRDTYKIRERAKVKITAQRADGAALPKSAEVAVIAVDEGLLELASNNTTDLLAAMMGERNIEVLTSTAQMQIVGKRHYGLKAVPHGGGGGRDKARELFDTLLLWKGRVALDKNGQAVIDVPLNDSLTSFKIVAVANAGLGLFGSGAHSIATTQDVMVMSGLPPLVREGDKYNATFSIRNTTDKTLSLRVTGKTKPSVGNLAEQKIDLPAGAARDVAWTVMAPLNTTAIAWDVSVQALTEGASASKDRLAVKQDVIAAVPVRVYQATLMQIDKSLSVETKRPDDAIPGRGGIAVTLRSRLGDGLDGVVNYMQLYPYTCFEQLASRSIVLDKKDQWTSLMARLPGHLDRDGMVKYFPSSWIDGSDSLTSYILAVADEVGWDIPQYERERMIYALQQFVSGRILRSSGLQTADLSIRKLAAIEALARHQSAQPEMLNSLSIEPNLWPTSAVLDWVSILQRVDGIPQRAQKLTEAKQILRSRLNFQGTTMGFSTEKTDYLWWLMVSTDANAVRTILTMQSESDWREDIPRLVQGALGRQQRGRWNTTVANAWGVLAMKKFSAQFERDAVTGTTDVALGQKMEAVTWEDKKSIALPLFAQDGRPQTLTIDHTGAGRPWAIIQSKAALPLKQPLSSGYKIKRTVTAIERKNPNQWTRGDVVRVKLELEAQSDMTWVVVDDPIPAGATILGGGLGGDSATLTKNQEASGLAWLAFEERRFEGYRAYYRFVPKGKWSTEYTVRLNNPGDFQLPATRVEALYAPEMFGETPNAQFKVTAK